VESVAGHHRFGEIGDRLQQGLEAGDLVGFVSDVQLGQNQAGRVVQGRQKVDLAAVGLGRAAQALAVHGQATQFLGLS
jgi:hypothetical protein